LAVGLFLLLETLYHYTMSLFKFIRTSALCVMLFTVGCNKTETTSLAVGGGPMKVRIGYIGITCEAPIFCAVENGFF
jgi:NitT/TauT family transport system substrate-binding protein